VGDAQIQPAPAQQAAVYPNKRLGAWFSGVSQPVKGAGGHGLNVLIIT